MHITKHVTISAYDWEQYGRFFTVRPNYAENHWRPYMCVKTWQVKFPRRFIMEINAWTQDTNDPLVAQAVLYKAGKELCKTDVQRDFMGPFVCTIDERVSYTVNMATIPNRNFMEAYQTTRFVPIEKADAYEDAFDHDLRKNPPDKPVNVKSAWNICFPHNYVMTVQVVTDKNGRLYAIPTLSRNKRNFKMLYGTPVDTLTKPFVMRHNKMQFTANIVGHEIKKPENTEEKANAE